MALAVAGASACVVAAAPATPPPSSGAAGVGDPYFPQFGNGGYDVTHYGLDVSYDPDTDRLDGRAAVTARAADSAFWQVQVDDPQRDTMFASAVYQRGAMTLQVLRERIGDQKFFALLKAWTAQHRYGNADTAQFIALAERVGGQDLDSLFRTWIGSTGRPTIG
jgi:hypothetical protein